MKLLFCKYGIGSRLRSPGGNNGDTDGELINVAFAFRRRVAGGPGQVLGGHLPVQLRRHRAHRRQFQSSAPGRGDMGGGVLCAMVRTLSEARARVHESRQSA